MKRKLPCGCAACVSKRHVEKVVDKLIRLRTRNKFGRKFDALIQDAERHGYRIIFTLTGLKATKRRAKPVSKPNGQSDMGDYPSVTLL